MNLQETIPWSSWYDFKLSHRNIWQNRTCGIVFFCLTEINLLIISAVPKRIVPCMRPSRDRGILIQAVSLSFFVIALIKLFNVPFSCVLRSLRTIKHFQPMACILFQTGSKIYVTGCKIFWVKGYEVENIPKLRTAFSWKLFWSWLASPGSIEYSISCATILLSLLKINSF